jgi:Uma2 family endonuclease
MVTLHAAAMIGKRRLDLTIDPPPDLAIEVDVTSKTGLDAYQGLGVPELWDQTQGRSQTLKTFRQKIREQI